MRGDPYWAIEPLLANPAFLPSGKGALILILGGLAMLAITAVLARVTAGPPTRSSAGRTDRSAVVRRKPVPTRASSSRRPAKAAAATKRPGAAWANGLERAIQAMHGGRGRVTTANRTRCFFVLDDCRSCQRRRKRRDGCERERASIQKAAQASAPGASVVEKSCNPGRNGICIFEIRRDARA